MGVNVTNGFYGYNLEARYAIQYNDQLEERGISCDLQDIECVSEVL